MEVQEQEQGHISWRVYVSIAGEGAIRILAWEEC